MISRLVLQIKLFVIFGFSFVCMADNLVCCFSSACVGNDIDIDLITYVLAISERKVELWIQSQR